MMTATVLMATPAWSDEQVVATGPQAWLWQATRGLDATVGPLAANLAPPYAHEPNDPGDAYPGARRGVCGDAAGDLRGACNDYSGYRGTPRAWADLQAARVISPATGAHVPGNEGLSLWSSDLSESRFLATLGSGRALPPGAYLFGGPVGRWQDRDHRVEESVLLPLGSEAAYVAYQTGADSWVGNVVATTAQYRYKGYAPETCVLGGAGQVREYALCHPYRDGVEPDPNRYSPSESSGEFSPGCGLLPFLPPVVLRHGGGAWSVPIFVLPADPVDVGPASIRDYTGTAAPIALRTRCVDGLLTTTEMVLLPEGNLGLPVTTVLVLPAGQMEPLTDTDTYPGW